MNKKRIAIWLPILLLCFIGAYLLVDKIVQTPQEAQAMYEEAKVTCRSEIWLVYEDIGAVTPQEPARPPYPPHVTDITGGSFLHGYGCSREEALRQT